MTLCFYIFIVLEVYHQTRVPKVGRLGQRQAPYTFVRHCHLGIFLQKGCTNLRIPIFPESLHQNVQSCFLIFANLIGKKWYLSLVLTCVSLIMSKLEHFLTFEGHLCLVFVNYLFMGFCPLSLESLYISNIGLLFVEYIANIFPQIVIYL